MNLIRGTWTACGKCDGAQLPQPRSLAGDYFWCWCIKVDKKTTTIYTKRKTKTRILKNPRRKWEKSEYMNALGYLLRADKKRVEKEFGKIMHVLWIVKGIWEIDEKNLMNQIRMIKSTGCVTNTKIETIRRKIKN